MIWKKRYRNKTIIYKTYYSSSFEKLIERGEKMYCRKCGKELQDDWNICPNCGAKVQGDEKTAGAVSEEAHERPGKKIWRKWQFWLGIIALLIVIAAVVVIVLAGVKEKKPTTVSNQEKIIEQEETKPKEITDFSQQDFSEVLKNQKTIWKALA